MTKAKNLNLTELKKQSKKLDEKVEHEVLVNDTVYKFTIDNVFRKTKQYKVLDDLIAFLNEGNNNVELLDLTTPYTTLLIIKHFTSIDVSDNVDEALETLNILIDLELLNTILDLMPEDGIMSVYESIATTTDRMKDNIEETLKEVNKIRDEIENKELLEGLPEDVQ